MLLASRLSAWSVQPWAELVVAGVGLSFANWTAVVSPYVALFVLIRDLEVVLYSVCGS